MRKKVYSILNPVFMLADLLSFPDSKIVTAGTINIPQCQSCSCHPRKTLFSIPSLLMVYFKYSPTSGPLIVHLFH